jgi:hypothetical protein
MRFVFEGAKVGKRDEIFEGNLGEGLKSFRVSVFQGFRRLKRLMRLKSFRVSGLGDKI